MAKFPGKDKQSCVAVDGRKNVRSGTVAMGDFILAEKQFKARSPKSGTPTVDLYVIPQSRTLKEVTIAMTPLAGGKPKTVRSNEVQTADIWRYYSVHLGVPAPGKWRLSVVTGEDKGCFEVNFTQ